MTLRERAAEAWAAERRVNDDRVVRLAHDILGVDLSASEINDKGEFTVEGLTFRAVMWSGYPRPEDYLELVIPGGLGLRVRDLTWLGAQLATSDIWK